MVTLGYDFHQLYGYIMSIFFISRLSTYVRVFRYKLYVTQIHVFFHTIYERVISY